MAEVWLLYTKLQRAGVLIIIPPCRAKRRKVCFKNVHKAKKQKRTLSKRQQQNNWPIKEHDFVVLFYFVFHSIFLIFEIIFPSLDKLYCNSSIKVYIDFRNDQNLTNNFEVDI